jgi:hypothetical protein
LAILYVYGFMSAGVFAAVGSSAATPVDVASARTATPNTP